MKRHIFFAVILVSFFHKAQTSELKDALLEEKQGAIHNIAMSDLSSVTPSEGTLTPAQAPALDTESAISSQERFSMYKKRMRKRVCLGAGLGIALATACMIGFLPRSHTSTNFIPLCKDTALNENGTLIPNQVWTVKAYNCGKYCSRSQAMRPFFADYQVHIDANSLKEHVLSQCDSGAQACIEQAACEDYQPDECAPFIDPNWYAFSDIFTCCTKGVCGRQTIKKSELKLQRRITDLTHKIHVQSVAKKTKQKQHFNSGR